MQTCILRLDIPKISDPHRLEGWSWFDNRWQADHGGPWPFPVWSSWKSHNNHCHCQLPVCLPICQGDVVSLEMLCRQTFSPNEQSVLVMSRTIGILENVMWYGNVREQGYQPGFVFECDYCWNIKKSCHSIQRRVLTHQVSKPSLI